MIYCVYLKYLAAISKTVKRDPAATVASPFRNWPASIEDLRGQPMAFSGGMSLVHRLCGIVAARGRCSGVPAARGNYGASSQIGAGG